MERLRTDYCVVGAGFAGLAAARRLRDRGKSVALLEARDRVGGRVWNRTAADGTVVSVGGTWLGKRQDRMFEFCRELGVEVYPHYDRGDTVIHLDGANRRYQGYPKIGLFGLVSLGLAFWQLDRMTKRLPLEEPWKASGAKELDFIDARCVGRFAMERAVGDGTKTDEHDNDDAVLRRSGRGFAPWFIRARSRRRRL